MRMISVFSPSHQRLKEEWFLRTVKGDYDVRVYPCDARGQGRYMEDDWRQAVLFKSARIIDAIQENWNDTLVYSDVDVVFFRPTKEAILRSLADKDIVCQRDDPAGTLCTGFFALRANEATLQLWQDVRQSVEREGRDQLAFNRLVRERPHLRAGCLPAAFFGTGTFSGRNVQGRTRFHIPRNPAMFHANWTVGVDEKIMLLARALRVVAEGEVSRRVNNMFVSGIELRRKGRRAVGVLMRHLQGFSRRHARRYRFDGGFSRPRRVALDVSTVCQLKCPSCPTANGTIAKSIGAGFLGAAKFEAFLQSHPWVSDIELSNWGEVFLNRDLEDIFRHAAAKGVAIRIDNGANLDRVSSRALEALVRYGVRSVTCSIDGASQETYSIYRVNGNFDRVIDHIRQINVFKHQYRSQYPSLRWQFVAFGHNTHEIDKARGMAHELGMDFYLKLSWDDLYATAFSPIREREVMKTQSGLGVADRREYEETFGRSYIAESCHQLWLRPRINFDGRLLGCSINHWSDFGNVFSSGLESVLNSDRVKRTKEMLMGRGTATDDAPCLRCSVYQSMRAYNAWVRPEDLVHKGEGGGANRAKGGRAGRWSRLLGST